MGVGSCIQHEIHPLLLNFNHELEKEFLRFRLFSDKNQQHSLHILVFLEFAALELGTWFTQSESLWLLPCAISAPFIAAFLLFRSLIIHKDYAWIPEEVVECMDQVFHLICVIKFGIVGDVSLFLAWLLQGPIIFPARFKRFFLTSVIGLISFLLCISGRCSTYEFVRSIVLGVAATLVHSFGHHRSEVKCRESFMLLRQVKKDFEENMRLAGECLNIEQESKTAKNRVLEMVLDELQNPCQAISTMCDTLLEKDEESALVIQRSTKMIVSVLNSFSDYKNVGLNQRVPVDLAEVAEDTFETMSQNLFSSEKQIEAVYSFDESLAEATTILSDGDLVRKILLHLVSNSIKSCEKGHIRVSFSLVGGESQFSMTKPNQKRGGVLIGGVGSNSDSEMLGRTKPFRMSPGHIQRSDSDPPPITPSILIDRNPVPRSHTHPLGSKQKQLFMSQLARRGPTNVPFNRQMLCITVTDTGSGLCEEELSELSRQLDSNFSGDSVAHGLDLLVVKKSVSEMGGSVQVSSAGPGLGTTFSVFLPYIPTPPISSPIIPYVPLIQKNLILVSVNSNFVAQKSLSQILYKNFGHEAHVFSVCSTQKASVWLGNSIDYFGKPGEPILVVFLIDLNALGGDSGFDDLRQLVLQIRSTDPQQGCRRFANILISPTSGVLKGEQVLQELGFSAKMAKPVRQQCLIREIDRICETNRFPRSGRVPTPPPTERPPQSARKFFKNRTIVISPNGEVPDGVANSEFPETLGTVISQDHDQQPSAFQFGKDFPTEQQKQKILIVEDNKIVQRALIRMLSSVYTCETADNGQEALTAIDQRSFDCVLMDFRMDVMDGITATTFIRQRLDEKRDIPIIGLSAEGLDSIRQEARNAGMDRFLVKPVQKSELLNTIQQVIEDNSS